MLRSDPIIKQRLEAVKTADISNRSKSFLRFFTTQDSYTFCNDINGLKTELNYQAVNEEWYLFMDSSKSSLKAALICDKYKFPTIPVAYCHVKEDKDSVKKLLEVLDYNNLSLPIVADLKVINFLLGLKSGFAKYPCFYCEFDSRNSEKDFAKDYVWQTKHDFPLEQLVDPDHIIFPFLHLKLGIFQKFIKSLDSCGRVVEYLKKKFQKSEAKTIKGIFNGPEIRSLINDAKFTLQMSTKELAVWKSYCKVHKNVLGKNILPNWSELIDEFIQNMKILGCTSMTPKMHLLYKHKDAFEKYLGRYSDEHGERLHE